MARRWSCSLNRHVSALAGVCLALRQALPSSLSLCSVTHKRISPALQPLFSPSFLFSPSDINCRRSHFLSLFRQSAPNLANLLRRKVKGCGGCGGGGCERRTLGCLCADLRQISRGYQQMAGVRWAGSRGCAKRKDKDVRRQAKV